MATNANKWTTSRPAIASQKPGRRQYRLDCLIVTQKRPTVYTASAIQSPEIFAPLLRTMATPNSTKTASAIPTYTKKRWTIFPKVNSLNDTLRCTPPSQRSPKHSRQRSPLADTAQLLRELQRTHRCWIANLDICSTSAGQIVLGKHCTLKRPSGPLGLWP